MPFQELIYIGQLCGTFPFIFSHSFLKERWITSKTQSVQMGFGAVPGSLYFPFSSLPSENVFLEVSHSNFPVSSPQDFNVFSDNTVAAGAKWPKQNQELYFPSFFTSGSSASLIFALALSSLLP